MSSIGLASLWSDRKATKRASYWYRFVTASAFDRANVDRIFKTCFATKRAGMGMGLSICRSILESPGGRISAARNADGPGSTIHFVLPIAMEPIGE